MVYFRARTGAYRQLSEMVIDGTPECQSWQLQESKNLTQDYVEEGHRSHGISSGARRPVGAGSMLRETVWRFARSILLQCHLCASSVKSVLVLACCRSLAVHNTTGGAASMAALQCAARAPLLRRRCRQCANGRLMIGFQRCAVWIRCRPTARRSLCP